MSGNSETPALGRFDNIKWGLVAILTAIAVYGNYYFAAEPLLMRIAGLLIFAVLAGLIALSTAKGSAFWTLLKEAKNEIRRVVWPTRQETVQTTLVVVAVVIVMGLVLWGLDSLLGWMISSLI